MRGLGLIKRWLRPSQTRAIILCYHRVVELSTDPQLLAVAPNHFAEQLDLLRRHFHVTRLDKWISDQPNGLSVILTFDDGYGDNLHQALPLLRAANCPATMFITAGKIGDLSEFWWDELERLLLIAPELPNSLSLLIAGKNYKWRLTSEAAAHASFRGWNVQLNSKPSPRQTIYLDLCQLLREVDELSGRGCSLTYKTG